MFTKHYYVFLAVMLLSTACFAQDDQAAQESVLPPGAFLVAGNLDKNEFFIVGKDDFDPFPVQKPLASVPEKKKVHQVAAVKPSKNVVPRMKVVLSRALFKVKVVKSNPKTKVVFSNKKQRPIKVALKKTAKHSVTINKAKSPMQVAIKKPVHHQLMAKKPNALINGVPQRPDIKLVAKNKLSKKPLVKSKIKSRVVLLNRAKHQPKNVPVYKV